ARRICRRRGGEVRIDRRSLCRRPAVVRQRHARCVRAIVGGADARPADRRDRDAARARTDGHPAVSRRGTEPGGNRPGARRRVGARLPDQGIGARPAEEGDAARRG
ncbi:hypothetical protein LTR94_032364, partial [Friedmanniomyces endolithicus]